jgi:hypothetical protein
MQGRVMLMLVLRQMAPCSAATHLARRAGKGVAN